MKKLLFITAAMLTGIAGNAGDWTPWQTVGYGIEVSFKFSDRKTCIGYNYVRMRNTSSATYCYVRVIFDTSCDGDLRNGAIADNNMAPGKVEEATGNWFSSDAGVKNIRIETLQDAKCKTLVRNPASKPAEAKKQTTGVNQDDVRSFTKLPNGQVVEDKTNPGVETKRPPTAVYQDDVKVLTQETDDDQIEKLLGQLAEVTEKVSNAATAGDNSGSTENFRKIIPILEQLIRLYDRNPEYKDLSAPLKQQLESLKELMKN